MEWFSKSLKKVTCYFLINTNCFWEVCIWGKRTDQRAVQHLELHGFSPEGVMFLFVWFLRSLFKQLVNSTDYLSILLVFGNDAKFSTLCWGEANLVNGADDLLSSSLSFNSNLTSALFRRVMSYSLFCPVCVLWWCNSSTKSVVLDSLSGFFPRSCCFGWLSSCSSLLHLPYR